MMIRAGLIALRLGAVALAWAFVAAKAAPSGLPNLDLLETCRGDNGSTTGRTNDACLRDENAAKRQVRDMWSKIPVSVRRSCLDEVKIGGSPSYVELLTCAQMNEWSKEQPNPTAPGQVSNPGAARAGTARP